MAERIGSPRDAASTLFNLPDAEWLPLGRSRRPVGGSTWKSRVNRVVRAAGCPGCGCIHQGRSGSGTSLSEVR